MATESQYVPATAVAGVPARPPRPAQPPVQPPAPAQPSTQNPFRPPAAVPDQASVPARKASRPPVDYDQVAYSRKPHENSVFLVPGKILPEVDTLRIKNDIIIPQTFIFLIYMPLSCFTFAN